ncbi:MAG: hypothetical protein KGL19_06080 [Bacteroidota bacterium]|nr:hypothetical protein [Bacteroidota bacterium]
MKKILIIILSAILFTSCGLFGKANKNQVGCPPSGKNMGAEKLLVYEQQGYKPRTAKEKKEYEAAMKELKNKKSITKEGVNTNN